MNKIAVYLNQHLLGEVSSAKTLRKLYSTDGSVLTVTPEVVAFPRITNDIRKIARFTWQLAEKGHVVGITVRGYGGDTTGGAIGKGVVIDTSRQLNSVIEVAPKDKLIHVQPGAALSQIDEALRWQGLMVPGAFHRGVRSISVGGAISSDSFGVQGSIADSIKRLEVILANGDIIETGRISKREVSKKLGLQTLEGEIYRKIEGLIEDNESLISKLANDRTRDNTGYKRIADVRRKDGSFDLTPLLVGSQGTLGIISEAVLKADFLSVDEIHAIIVTESTSKARDATKQLLELQPSEMTVIDGELLRRATKNGTQFNVVGSVEQTGALVYVRFNDFGDRTQMRKLKRMQKILAKMNLSAIDSTKRDIADFRAITSLSQILRLGSSDDNVALPVLDGAAVPAEHYEEFEESLTELAKRHRVELPFELNTLSGVYTLYPLLKLDSVGDKQKLFKIMAEYAATVTKLGGVFTADGAEGRVKANAAWATLSDEEAKLYEEIRTIFDPHGTLNPGVKQIADMRTLASMLRTGYSGASVL